MKNLTIPKNSTDNKNLNIRLRLRKIVGRTLVVYIAGLVLYVCMFNSPISKALFHLLIIP
jgi:hypothetical protein